jgi:two-component system nitrogen regulation response regulator GlnG
VPRAGIEIADESGLDAILLDVRLPAMDGLQAMKHLRAAAGPGPIILITAYGDLDTAVQAVRESAFEYIVNPFDLQTIESVIGRALASRPRAASRANFLQTPDPPHGLIGDSPARQQVYKQIALAAAARRLGMHRTTLKRRLQQRRHDDERRSN